MALIISDLTLAKLEDAPIEIKMLINKLPQTSLEFIDIDDEVIALKNSYIKHKILTPKSDNDAIHMEVPFNDE